MSSLDLEPQDPIRAAKNARFRYLFGVHLPTGHFEAADIKSVLPPDLFSEKWERFLKTLSLEGPMGVSETSGTGLRSHYFEAGALSVTRNCDKVLEKTLSSAKGLSMIEIHVSVKKQRPFVPVKIVSYEGAKAHCKARYEGYWLAVQLDCQSLKNLDLREGDTFEWIPREDGLVLADDIRRHPRKSDPGDYERAERAFQRLTKLQAEAGG